MNHKYKSIHPVFLLTALTVILTMAVSACQPGPQPETADESNLLVTVSIPPQAYFVDRITGETVEVNIMVGPGDDPHTYEPRPEQMRALSDSDLFFTIGTEYEEAWIPRFRDVNPELVFVDSAEGIQRIELTEPHTHDHDEYDDHHDDDIHEDDHHDDVHNDDHHDEDIHHDNDHHDEDHSHDHGYGFDPHVWLTPQNGKAIATNILNALIELMPDQADFFQANYDALIAEIDDLDARIERTLEGLEKRTFMVFHPAWGYFAEAYNLEQIAIEVSGQEPSARQLAEIIDTAREEDIKVIFVQPAFSPANVNAIAQEINAEVAMADPLARDWLANLEKVAAAFAQALSD